MRNSESKTQDNGIESTDGLTEAGLGRRTFIGTAAAALLAGVVIQITGCSTDDKEEPKSEGETGLITDNHPAPHKAIITAAQLTAGGNLTLDIQGSADHTHSVVLTADQMADIKAGNHVMGTSTVTGHAHVVMFN